MTSTATLYDYQGYLVTEKFQTQCRICGEPRDPSITLALCRKHFRPYHTATERQRRARRRAEKRLKD